MEKDEILLGVKMERLEIEPVKINKNRSNVAFTNYYQNCIFNGTNVKKEMQCTCSTQKKVNNSGIIKRKPKKILKEPLLKFLKTHTHISTVVKTEECQKTWSKNFLDNDFNDSLNVCTLVRNCNELKISLSKTELGSMATNTNQQGNIWWKQNPCNRLTECKEPRQQSSQPGSCSQQALNPPCDVTIDELASYFETLVHIPKKMSSMAEMMYI